MKFRIHGMFLSFFALALCFSFSTEASAHDYPRSDGQKTYTHTETYIEAGDITDPANEAHIKQLLLHVVGHLKLIQEDMDFAGNLIAQSRETVIFGKAARDEGVFNNGNDIYTLGISPRGAMTNHPLYQHLLNSKYDLEAQPLKTLVSARNISDSTAAAPVEPECATYTDHNNESRVACAIKQDTQQGEITSIAGFHHAEDALTPPDCNDFTLDVTAKQVEEEENLDEKRDLLKQYVKDVIEKTEDLLLATAAEVGLDPQVPLAIRQNPFSQEFAAEVTTRVYEKIVCFGKDGQRDNGENDFFHGSIYAFIMDPLRGTSFVNGLDFNLHGLSIALRDPDPIGDEPNVLAAFLKELTGGSGEVADLMHGSSGTVRYHWDDPTTEDDNVSDFLEQDPPVVPGTSIKESYIEVVDLNENTGVADQPGVEPVYFVFGSGIYPGSDSMPPGNGMTAAADDDGCSIAATGSNHQSALLNLLLAAFVLFSAVFLRKRG